MFDRINNYRLDGKRYLFFDIFYKNATRELIVITPYYITVPIKIICDGKYLALKTGFGQNSAYVFTYDLAMDYSQFVDVTVHNEDIFAFYRLYNIQNTRQYKLCCTTLFKDDHYLLNRFMRYYTIQGVEHFYMYYNGRLKDLNVPARDNVTFIEWDYAYYIRSKDGHAQSGQLNHALHKYGKGSAEHMAFNDLDEYMFVPNSNVINLLNDHAHENVNTYMFLNIWSDTIEIPVDIEAYYDELKDEVMPSSFVIKNEIYAPSHSSKCIHKSDNIVLIENIHCGQHYSNPGIVYKDTVDITNIVNNNILFHFFRWSRPHVDHSHRTREDMGIFDNYTILHIN